MEAKNRIEKKKEETTRVKLKAIVKKVKDYAIEEEYKALTTTEGKYTIPQTQLSQRQLLKIVSKTPEQHIRTRPGKGGKQVIYVTGTYMKKVLNYVFGWLWNFDILEHGVVEENGRKKFIWVKGKLSILHPKTLEPIIWKTQFGGAEIKYLKAGGIMDFGNDLKSAATDCLKKCASELGIASDVYGVNEFSDLEDKSKNNVSVNPENKNVIIEKSNKFSEWEKAIRDIQADIKYNNNQIQEILFKYGKVKDIRNLTEDGFKEVFNRLLDIKCSQEEGR